MAHYAKIENRIVTQVIAAEQNFIDSGYVGEPTDWVQTSYNTYGNQHPEGRPLRGNYAGIGYTYNATNDVFYAPQPYPSWTLNNTTWLWEAPVTMPTNGKNYKWNESITNWEEVTL